MSLVNPKQDVGYLESSQRLVHVGNRRWSQRDLLKAAERAELHNTGWPIGLVLSTQGLAPVPTPEGVEARLGRYPGHDWEDYWAFYLDGSYYVIRLFEEDFEDLSFSSSLGHPEKALWFDIRIWRIAEVILHSAHLYKELGIPPDEPYLLAVNHGGLLGREFYASSAGWAIRRGRISRTSEAKWTKELTQDQAVSDLKGLVTEAATGLFVLFDFAEVAKSTSDDIVDRFLRRRV